MQAARMVKRESGTRRTQAERSETTRGALIDAARTLFATKGYARSGREEIVAAAGVTRGALQHHFGDKQGLFTAVYEAVEQEVVAATALAGMTAGDDPVEQLRAGCRAYLDAVLDPAVQRICAVDGPAVLPADMRQEITDRYALGLVRETVQAAMEQGRIDRAPVEPLTRMLLAGITAAAMYVATAPDPKAARAEAGATVDLLLDSLKR
ncbi:MAG: TetR/AcrR family transcriptional regulator [Acidimicrobiales bacterium]